MREEIFTATTPCLQMLSNGKAVQAVAESEVSCNMKTGFSTYQELQTFRGQVQHGGEKETWGEDVAAPAVAAGPPSPAVDPWRQDPGTQP